MSLFHLEDEDGPLDSGSWPLLERIVTGTIRLPKHRAAEPTWDEIIRGSTGEPVLHEPATRIAHARESVR